MRKTLIAIALGLTALTAAACGNSGAGSSPDSSFEPVMPIESALPSDMMESPSDMMESPSDMLESPAAS